MSALHYRAMTPRGAFLDRSGRAARTPWQAAGWTTLKKAREVVHQWKPGLYTIYNLRTIKAVERVDTRSKQ